MKKWEFYSKKLAIINKKTDMIYIFKKMLEFEAIKKQTKSLGDNPFDGGGYISDVQKAIELLGFHLLGNIVR